MDRADYYRPGNDAARRAYEENFKAQHAARFEVATVKNSKADFAAILAEIERDERAAHAARKAQEAAAEVPAPVAEDATPDAERIEDGTLVEVDAGTFRAYLGTVVGVGESIEDGRTWIVYVLELSSRRIGYAREDRVTIVPE